MEGEASIYEPGIATGNQRLELTQRRHPLVDSPIHKSGMVKDHQPNVPGYVEIAAGGSDTHQVVVSLNRGTRLAAVEVRARLVRARQNAIVGIREWKYIYMVAIEWLAVQLVRRNLRAPRIDELKTRRCRLRACVGRDRTVQRCL